MYEHGSVSIIMYPAGILMQIQDPFRTKKPHRIPDVLDSMRAYTIPAIFLILRQKFAQGQRLLFL